jgi:hypothetical protein
LRSPLFSSCYRYFAYSSIASLLVCPS